MYKIIKSKGDDKPVIIKNTDTNAQIMLGDVSSSIAHKVSKDVADKWDFEITEELALTFIKNIAGDVTKKPQTEQQPPQTQIRKRVIDAFDLIFDVAQ